MGPCGFQNEKPCTWHDLGENAKHFVTSWAKKIWSALTTSTSSDVAEGARGAAKKFNPAMLEGAGALGEAAASRAAAAEAGATASNPLAGTTYSAKVQSQMAQPGDLYHGFPSIIDQFAGEGSMSNIVGNDGTTRSLLELPGAVNGKSGNFQWIIEPDNTVNHRLFVPQ